MNTPTPSDTPRYDEAMKSGHWTPERCAKAFEKELHFVERELAAEKARAKELADYLATREAKLASVWLPRDQERFNEVLADRDALAAQVKQLREALESAPEPVCINTVACQAYKSPHTVKNFSDIDEWWLKTRRAALAATAPKKDKP